MRSAATENLSVSATLIEVANTQWLDRSQPQPLYMANMLLYINAVFWLLSLFTGGGLFVILALGAVFAGLGIANEKKAGYWGGVVVAVLNFLVLVLVLLVGRVGQHFLVHQHPFRRCPAGVAPSPAEPELPAHLVQEVEPPVTGRPQPRKLLPDCHWSSLIGTSLA